MLHSDKPPQAATPKRRWFQRTENEPRQQSDSNDLAELLEEVKQVFRDFAEDQADEYRQAMESAIAQVKEHLATSVSQSYECTDEQLQVIAERIAENIAKRTPQHPVGLCNNNECRVCPEQRNRITWDALQKVEERVPGTRDQMAQWTLDNTPTELVDEEGRPIEIIG